LPQGPIPEPTPQLIDDDEFDIPIDLSPFKYGLQQPPVTAAPPQGNTHTQREEMDDGFMNIDVATGSQGPLSPPASTPAGRGRGQPRGRPRGSLTALGGEHNRASKLARHGGHGRGRPRSSSGTGRGQNAQMENFMLSWLGLSKSSTDDKASY